MKKGSRIFVAGHQGLVGSAIVRRLLASGYGYNDLLLRTRGELDLTNQVAVESFFAAERPEYVFLAAAKVGGIYANNNFRADFIRQNLAIQTNVIHEAWRNHVSRLLFLGSSCIYPRDCPQPIREEYFLSGPLEETNRPYAVAKIAGVEMCGAYNRQHGSQFLCVMPTNTYGQNDTYDLMNAHVIPALIRKFHEAKIRDDKNVVVWGTGAPRREFLYGDDLADACVFLMNLPDDVFNTLLGDGDAMCAPLINVGYGEDVTIRELAETIKAVVDYRGNIVFDTTKPDGTPRKLLDVSRINKLGWIPAVRLQTGLKRAYDHYCG